MRGPRRGGRAGSPHRRGAVPSGVSPSARARSRPRRPRRPGGSAGWALQHQPCLVELVRGHQHADGMRTHHLPGHRELVGEVVLLTAWGSPPPRGRPRPSGPASGWTPRPARRIPRCPGASACAQCTPRRRRVAAWPRRAAALWGAAAGTRSCWSACRSTVGGRRAGSPRRRAGSGSPRRRGGGSARGRRAGASPDVASGLSASSLLSPTSNSATP